MIGGNWQIIACSFYKSDVNGKNIKWSILYTMDSFKKIIIVEKSMKPRYDENGYFLINNKTH